MYLLQQIVFIIITVVAILLFSKKVREIRRNINLGRPEDLTDQRPRRWKNLFLLAFGQKKMFRNPLVAVLHYFFYAGFIIINLEVLEIMLDGILGTHRLFLVPGGVFYIFLINSFEILALLVLAACVVFLLRRNVIRLKRFISKDLTGWPRRDANIILITEIILMTLFLTLNASDTLLQSRSFEHYGESLTGNFIISHQLQPLLNGLSNERLVFVERVCWWMHIVGIYIFLN